MGDSVELKLIESESLLHFDDVESPNAPPAISPKSTWAGMPSFSSSTIPELVSYFGFRGVVIILLLKVLTVVIFALFFFGPSNTKSSAGDYSTVGLVVGRPEGLREIIRESSRNAAVLSAGSHKALFTLQTRRELVYDNYIEFILSYPWGSRASATLDRESSTESSGNDWQTTKNDVATITAASTMEEISAARANARNTADPLSVRSMDPSLVVHRFAEDSSTAGAGKEQFSIVLNKFNTIRDHCLLVTDTYTPQISPLSGVELELLHWILLQTRGVGFYNSNLMAGASQAHKHTQFIPGDSMWALRNPDATHALPIDDVIMPRIESGKWHPYPYIAKSRSSSHHSYASTLDSKKRFQSGMLHQLRQFEFQHAVAVLLDRSAFLQEANPLEAYSEYLRNAYEALLLVNDISLESLEDCANADGEDVVADSSEKDIFHPRNLQSVADNDDLISEGDLSRAEKHKPSVYEAAANERLEREKLALHKKSMDCQRDVGYNLILRPQYMLLAVRGQKDIAGVVNVNSFGFMGMFLTTTDVSHQLLKDIGPLEVLRSVGKELTTPCSH